MRPSNFSDAQIRQIAILLTEHRKTQAQIADLFDESRTTVNRAVEKAIDAGYLKRVPPYQMTRILEEDRSSHEGATVVLGVKPLLEKIQGAERNAGQRNFRNLHIVGTPGTPSDGRFHGFAEPAAAALVKELSHDTRSRDLSIIGVSWGETLLSVTKALHRLTPQPTRHHDLVTYIPIAGAPPDVEVFEERSSAHLAWEFSRILNAEHAPSRSFSVQAWIPAQFGDEQSEVIRKFCMTSPMYAQAFSEGGLSSRLDCILTSVGAITEFSSPWLDAAAAAGPIKSKELSRIVIGNISGCFLPQLDASKSQCKTIDAINDRWLGLQLPGFKRCADKSTAQGRTPGVILLSMGKEKAPIVLRAIEKGLVNVLIADQELAGALSEICDSGEVEPP